MDATLRVRLGLLLLILAVPAAASVPAARVSATPPGYTRYLFLTDTHLAPSGGAVWFTTASTLDGRVHTNGEMRFNGQPAFGDTVSSANPKAWFYNNGAPVELDDDHNGTIDVPQFAHGFLRGAPVVPLPANVFDQQKAALGLAPDGQEPSNNMIRTLLGVGTGATPPPNGIYLVHYAGTVSGGVYVQGNADRILAQADTVTGRQTYRLTQGATTEIISIDPAASTTSVTVGASTTVYSGLPRGVIYVTGQISDLRGPDRVGSLLLPALLDGQGLLVVAAGDIVIQRDLIVRNRHVGSAVLGILSGGGNVRVGSSAPNDAELDAFVMAIGPQCVFTVDNYSVGSPRGAFHLWGGCVQNHFGPFGAFTTGGAVQAGYARDFHHDDRGLVPPYFPPLPFDTTGTVGVAPDRAAGSLEPGLSAPWPNPWRGGAQRVSYALPSAGRVRLALYDVLGRRVATLVDAEQAAGSHQAVWEAGSLGAMRPGVYVLELSAGGRRARVRLVRLD